MEVAPLYTQNLQVDWILHRKLVGDDGDHLADYHRGHRSGRMRGTAGVTLSVLR